MIAACAADGPTVIYNAAREPEIVALQRYLAVLGARIEGAGSPVIRVYGMEPTAGGTFAIPPDRIAAATWLCCAVCAGGDVTLTDAPADQLRPVLALLRGMGCETEIGEDGLFLAAPFRPCSPGAVVTRPYPGFPTDAAPLLMAASLRAMGPTLFMENIFSGRYRHAEEMRRLGADIVLRGPMAIVTGRETLRGAALNSPDLRGGAALVAAALGAEGESVILDEDHIGRGYEDLGGTLGSLGASIRREQDNGSCIKE